MPVKFFDVVPTEPINELYYKRQANLKRADVTKQFLFPAYRLHQNDGEKSVRHMAGGSDENDNDPVEAGVPPSKGVHDPVEVTLTHFNAKFISFFYYYKTFK